MFVSKLKLTNWRNFRNAEADFQEIVYILGPNASGKSNLLDVFRFLRDIANPQGGGLQKAVSVRGGISKIRCLATRKHPIVGINITINGNTFEELSVEWKYVLEFKTKSGGRSIPIVEKEEVFCNGKNILSRPDKDDKNDPERLTQTALEQINLHKDFRALSDFFSGVLYLHLVAQLLKYGEQMAVRKMEADPFGQGFLDMLARTTDKTRLSRLRRIQDILKNVIQGFEELKFNRDETNGTPHLEMRYKHWRPNAGWQREDQFSDGTLRMIALIWTLLESNSMILLEEPELSLHDKIIEQIPGMIYQARQSRKSSDGQILISTHSKTMLSRNDIKAGFLVLEQKEKGEGTKIFPPSQDDRNAMRAGMSPADIIMPKTGENIRSIPE